MTVTKYYSKLVGVTFEGRQDIIADLTGDEQLRFRREPDNEYDKNAVAVDVLATAPGMAYEEKVSEWLPIGYIAKDNNTELAQILDEEKQAKIRLKDITGGDDKAYGLNVEIEYEKQPKGKLLKDFFGNEIYYDEVNHIYSWNGEVYESGSQYAKKNKKPFDAQMISNVVAKKYNVEAKDVANLWELSGKVSRDFGTNVHQALEIYGKYKSLSKSVEKEYHIPNHPVLKSIIESFFAGRDKETAEYEVLVVDHKNKRAGTIDRLLITAPKTVIIQDFKITHKEDKEYWQDQLGFYKTIVEANGWTVAGKEIYHYTDKWNTIKV